MTEQQIEQAAERVFTLVQAPPAVLPEGDVVDWCHGVGAAMKHKDAYLRLLADMDDPELAGQHNRAMALVRAAEAETGMLIPGFADLCRQMVEMCLFVARCRRIAFDYVPDPVAEEWAGAIAKHIAAFPLGSDTRPPPANVTRH